MKKENKKQILSEQDKRIEEVQQILLKRMRHVMENKEEILEAFIAKYGLHPEQIEMVTQNKENGDTVWWVRRRTVDFEIPVSVFIPKVEGKVAVLRPDYRAHLQHAMREIIAVEVRPLLVGGQTVFIHEQDKPMPRIILRIDSEQKADQASISTWHELLHLFNAMGGKEHDEKTIEAQAIKLAQVCPEIIEILNIRELLDENNPTEEP